LYKRLISSESGALSKSEMKGIVYIWGTNNNGQLGVSNRANKKINEMDDEKKILYPRLLTFFKNLVII
jgi:alpha-tubulin suppressor-like RCC1 family protein